MGQMITDDWGSGLEGEWENHSGEGLDWRFTGMPRKDMQGVTVLSDDSAVDIEGGSSGLSGELLYAHAILPRSLLQAFSNS